MGFKADQLTLPRAGLAMADGRSGSLALCQPWSLTLHSYGVTIILVGLVGFSVFSKIKPAPARE